MLVQRERELETIERMVADASGRGALVVVEGPPGIGKSRLLAEARERARARGRTVLAARATELEREFPFGVVRQLFESRLVGLPARERRRLLSGPALGAAAVFPGLVPDVAPDSGDVSFARLHGLYWLTANTASAAPLLIVIDDLHWADTASLRWLLYLLPRLEDLPLLIVVGRRPDVPDADAATHAAIVDDPLATVLRPGALGSAAVARMLAAELGRVPDAEFTAACVAATGGNPLFLRELTVAIAAEGLEPVRDGLRRLDEIGGQAISRLIEVRLSCLPAPSRAGARLRRAG
jgi:predicted ATPase